MRSRFQPPRHHPPLSGCKSVLSEIRRLPGVPSRTLSKWLEKLEEETPVETSIFGVSAAGPGLVRVIVRNKTGPASHLRMGFFGGIERSGMEVISHLQPYLLGKLRRRNQLRTEIRAYPLVYPSAWFPGKKQESLLPEIWAGSRLPEAYYLERELAVQRFHLVLTLHRSPDENVHLETSSAVIHQDLLLPVREAVLRIVPGFTDSFPLPRLHDSFSGRLVSRSGHGGDALEIALRIPPSSNPWITTKIFEEIEDQYPALLAYQAFI